MIIFAIDPGTTESAFVRWNGEKILSIGKQLNDDLVAYGTGDDINAIEMIASYGMPVGKEVFETCVWIGRFMQAWGGAELVYRKDVKMHLCGTTKAKDGNVRQALIDRLGAPGTKKNPGATYGVSGDMWQALALAVTYYDKLREAP